ncbi:hypothetical protein BPO_0380 [Bergeyella porcorum]|uniref:Uncharacterized protein n=1 Tax=Bergeyella porcorum TaxID=1735111 RepID=A0AAU0F016_9FLAO
MEGVFLVQLKINVLKLSQFEKKIKYQMEIQ